MKDTLAMVSLLVGLCSLTASVGGLEQEGACPVLCKCEIRPWFSPASIYMETHTVDCNDLGLLAVPETLPLNTQVFQSQSNNIAEINRPLDYLVNLTEIDLSHNSISSMSVIPLGILPQLLSLHLEENSIHTLQDNCLANLSNLQEFYINHNFVSFISPGAFNGLSRLLRLHLNSNQLRTINKEWFVPLTQLEILMIGENPVAQIQDMNFSPLRNLRSLVLARMNLSEIPSSTLVGLDNLESVSFFDNMFSKVPQAALRRVQSLRFLDLNKNPIERIQRGDFMDMIHLKELGINSMPELVSIDGFALSNLPELTKIEVTNNPRLSYVHPNAFNKLPNLETLMLNSNALTALHRSTVESLPNLREVSMHSNPIHCDCVIRWINMIKTNIRFMEPDALLCFGPPEFEGQHVRQVPSREMMEICLPLISSEIFPERVNAKSGYTVSLHCRAFAEPEPEIYWVTPSGEKILPGMESKTYHLHPEGTFDIYHITEQEAGEYSCVAHNLIGADIKSVLVVVNGHHPKPFNKSLNLQIKEVRSHSVLISWESPSGGLVSNIKWSTAPVRKHPTLQPKARVPSDVKTFNLTHLDPLTAYEVCVEIPGVAHGLMRNCVNVSTTEQAVAMEITGTGVEATIATTSMLLIVAAVVCSLVYMSLRSEHFYRKLTNQKPGTPPTPCASPSCNFTRLLRSQGKVTATVIDPSNNSI